MQATSYQVSWTLGTLNLHPAKITNDINCSVLAISNHRSTLHRQISQNIGQIGGSKNFIKVKCIPLMGMQTKSQSSPI